MKKLFNQDYLKEKESYWLDVRNCSSSPFQASHANEMFAIYQELIRCYSLLDKAEHVAKLASIADEGNDTTTRHIIANMAKRFLIELEQK